MTDESSVDWSELEADATSDQTNGPGPLILTTEMVDRRFLWSIVPCDIAQETAKYLGLPPISQDVEEMEHLAAHARLNELGSLMPMIFLMNKVAVRMAVSTMIVGHNDQEQAPVNEGLFNAAVDQYELPTFSIVRAVIAELISMGLVHTPHLVTLDQEQVDRLVEEQASPEDPSE